MNMFVHCLHQNGTKIYILYPCMCDRPHYISAAEDRILTIRIGRTVSLFPSVPLFCATHVPHSSSDIPAITSVSLLQVLRYATFITISPLVLTLFTVLTGRFIYLSFSLTSTESLQALILLTPLPHLFHPISLLFQCQI